MLALKLALVVNLININEPDVLLLRISVKLVHVS